MKKLFLLLIAFHLFAMTIVAQVIVTKQTHEPEFFIPKNHEQSFRKIAKFTTKSFYDRKSEWQHIIDSTWGRGDTLSKKLQIFNSYANGVHNQFDGFNSLQLNWDSLYNYYLNKITDSTSKGAFSAIMSRFAYSLKDMHTKVWDSTVVFTPLNPGIPILLLGSYLSVEHFGAVTTVLPDSTTLVLRVVPNHPLNLEPGDIILGYEGIPWKQLVQELFDAGLPMVAQTGGCKSADTYLNLFGAGLNWHLFNTIDILKHSTSNTVHLSVLPLLDLDIPPMGNNEQLSIPNIPFPNTYSNECVTYGMLENSNIGYIYLSQEWPPYTADAPFYEAVNSLKNTDGLIIDMRLNRGGWGFFPEAFKYLFNESLLTVEDSYRCNNSNFLLCPSGDSYDFKIDGTPPDLYDRPIAVLLGPTCVSMGDLTALRFKYHPMVRFFGASSDATHGDNRFITNYKGWYLRYSISDMFHTNNPGVYLNRREFPIDYPVWFNKDNVANGKDDIVESALEWINNLVYGHNLTKNTSYCHPGIDTLKISNLVENPNSHQISSKIYIKSVEGSYIDSVLLSKTGLIGNSEIWSGNYLPPDSENIFTISLNAEDKDDSKTWTTDNISRFTTTGPLKVPSIEYTKGRNDYYELKPYVRNDGDNKTIKGASIKLHCDDPWVASIQKFNLALPDIAPGETVGSAAKITVNYIDSLLPRPNTYFNIRAEISIDGWTYWVDSIQTIITGVDENPNQPFTFKLGQNYPNPFNPSTTIKYSIPTQSKVVIKIYDILGKEVTTLVDEYKPAGRYETKFNTYNLPSGVYFYQLKAGDFIETKKMVLLR